MSSWSEQDDEAWDDELLDAYAEDQDEDSETVSCPVCGADVYEDAERCPHCDSYIVHSSSGYPWKDRPTWWVVLGILGIVAVTWTLITVF